MSPLLVEVGVHQSLVKKDAILVGFRQSNPSRMKWSLVVVCFKLGAKVTVVIIIKKVNRLILRTL